MTTCKDCGQPIYWIDLTEGGMWYHESLIAILRCPAFPVEPAEMAA